MKAKPPFVIPLLVALVLAIASIVFLLMPRSSLLEEVREGGSSTLCETTPSHFNAAGWAPGDLLQYAYLMHARGEDRASTGESLEGAFTLQAVLSLYVQDVNDDRVVVLAGFSEVAMSVPSGRDLASEQFAEANPVTLIFGPAGQLTRVVAPRGTPMEEAHKLEGFYGFCSFAFRGHLEAWTLTEQQAGNSYLCHYRPEGNRVLKSRTYLANPADDFHREILASSWTGTPGAGWLAELEVNEEIRTYYSDHVQEGAFHLTLRRQATNSMPAALVALKERGAVDFVPQAVDPATIPKPEIVLAELDGLTKSGLRPTACGTSITALKLGLRASPEETARLAKDLVAAKFSPEVASCVLEALRLAQSPWTLGALISILEQPAACEPGLLYQTLATSGFSDLASPQLITATRALLGHESPSIRNAALLSLGNLASKHPEHLATFREAAQPWGESDDAARRENYWDAYRNAKDLSKRSEAEEALRNEMHEAVRESIEKYLAPAEDASPEDQPAGAEVPTQSSPTPEQN